MAPPSTTIAREPAAAADQQGEKIVGGQMSTRGHCLGSKQRRSGGIDDCRGVETVRGVQIRNVGRLAEPLDAERRHHLAPDRAEPGKG